MCQIFQHNKPSHRAHTVVSRWQQNVPKRVEPTQNVTKDSQHKKGRSPATCATS